MRQFLFTLAMAALLLGAVALCTAQEYYTITFTVENHKPGYLYSVVVTSETGNQTWTLTSPTPEFSITLPSGKYTVLISTPITLNVTEQTFGDFMVFYAPTAMARIEVNVLQNEYITVNVKGGPEYPHKSVSIAAQIDTSKLDSKLNQALENLTSWISSQEVSKWLSSIGVSSLSAQLTQDYKIKIYLVLKNGSSYTYTLTPRLRLAIYSDLFSATAEKTWSGSSTLVYQGSLPNVSATVDATLLWEFTAPISPIPINYTSPPTLPPSVFLAFTGSGTLPLNETSTTISLGSTFYQYTPSANITEPGAVTILSILAPALYAPPTNVTAPPLVNITAPANVTGPVNITAPPPSPPSPLTLQELLTSPVYLTSLVLFVVFIIVVAALMSRKSP